MPGRRRGVWEGGIWEGGVRESGIWDVAPEAAVLVPVKSFHQAKVRLAPALPASQRAALARAMGATVLGAATPLPVVVVCDDQEVATWAEGLGARVIWEPGMGLNRAVSVGVALLAAEGVGQVTVAHADMPLASDLASVGLTSGRRDRRVVVLAPDRRLDGTNVLAVPAGAGFCFSYGPGSFRRHVAEGCRLGLTVHVLRRPQLAWDIDVPDDLAGLPAIYSAALPISEAS